MPRTSSDRLVIKRSLTIENIKFHLVIVQGGPVKTSRKLAAKINFTGVGGGYESDDERNLQVFAFVSEGGQVYSHKVWEKMKENLVEQTGVARQKIQIEPQEEDGDEE